MVSIASNLRNECAVLRDGTARCRGSNTTGQLGSGVFDLGGATPRTVVGLGDTRQIALGGSVHMGLQADGTVRTWGSGSALGTVARDMCGGYRCNLSPQTVPDLDGVTAIAMVPNRACVLRTDRTVWCWGLVMDNPTRTQTGPTLTDDRGDVVELISLYSSIAFRRADGTLVTHGDGVGLGASMPPDWTLATGNAAHVCAVLPDRTVRCWGANYQGQTGRDRVDDLRVRTDPGIDCVRSVARGYQHTCALRTDGSVWCWGRNDRGQSGAPNEEERDCPDGSGPYFVVRPRRVEGLDHVDALFLGYGRSCAIRSDRTVWCWGASDDPSATNLHRPVRNDWR